MPLAEAKVSQTDPARFWALVDELIATSEIVIDLEEGAGG